MQRRARSGGGKRQEQRASGSLEKQRRKGERVGASSVHDKGRGGGTGTPATHHVAGPDRDGIGSGGVGV
jgi:hypothetical protein